MEKQLDAKTLKETSISEADNFEKNINQRLADIDADIEYHKEKIAADEQAKKEILARMRAFSASYADATPTASSSDSNVTTAENTTSAI